MIRRASVLLPALVLLIGLALRLAMLGRDARLHPDEALFASQARLISQHGDVFLNAAALDKPPLTLFITAVSFELLGPTEFAARLPNVLFSGATLTALYALAHALYRDRRVALPAMLLLALSPYDIAFAATVFTDVQATFWIVIAAYAAVRDRQRLAGVAAALAFASKSNAILFVPLILALGMAQHAGANGRDLLRRGGEFIGPLLVGIGLLVVWDTARDAPSFFALNIQHNAPRRLIRSDEVGPRLTVWLRYLSTLSGLRPLNLALLTGGPLWLAYGAVRDRSRRAVSDWLIGGFALAFMAWHWLIAFNTYDRYLHPLVPFLLLLAARIMGGIMQIFTTEAAEKSIVEEKGSSPPYRKVQKHFSRLLSLCYFGVFGVLGGQLLVHEAPGVGSSPGAHPGIDRLAAYLNTELAGEIVYDYWLGWELSYYLGGDPQVIVLYMPLPDALADDMSRQPFARYFVAPAPADAAPWLDALHRAGVTTALVYADGFAVYRLTAPQ